MCSDLDAIVLTELERDAASAPSGPVVDTFVLVQPEDVSKLLGGLSPTTCSLDSCLCHGW